MSPESAFRDTGIVYPVDILDGKEVEKCRRKLSLYMDKVHWKLTPMTRHKPHMIFPWIRQLAAHEKILSSIKPILGDDILLWYSVIFVKPPASDMYVPWHQDATYWALKNRDEGLTVWLALNDVNRHNGSMSYLPGSHHLVLDSDHSISRNRQNILARGQVLNGVVAKNEKWISLNAGQASIHHNMLVHRSEPNHSNQPRLGIAFRYIKPDNRPVTLKWMKRSATLVSGKDCHHHFAQDPNPINDSLAKCKRAHLISSIKATLHTLAGDTNRNIIKKVTDSIPTVLANLPKISRN